MSGSDNTTGRPTKLNDELMEKFCGHLEEGLSLIATSGLCDVSYTTVKNWRNRGKEGEEPYATFLAKSARAQSIGRAQMERSMLKHLYSDDPRAMSSGVSAAAKAIKTQYPEPHRVELSGDRDNPVQTETSKRRDYSKLTDGELEQLEALHAKAERE